MSPAPRRFVGVDVGTGGARALAVDDDGTVVAQARRALDSRRGTGPDGTTRHEQDPRDWIAAVCGAVGQVVAALDPATVAGIAVDATSGTVVLTGDDGEHLSPGVMYDDARGAAHAPRVREAGAALWDRLGVRVGASWALPTLMELLAGPGAGAARVRHQADVVNAWLVGGPVATDAATALKTGYDVEALCWPETLLAGLGIDPAALPAVVTSGTPLGVVGASAAASTGLPAGVPVLAGTTDGCAAQFGAGAVTPGSWHAVLGTTLILKGVVTTRPRDPSGTVYSHRCPQGGWWLPGGASSTGAGVLAELLDPDRLDALTARVRADPPARVPVAYPLSGRGERFPFAADDATGFWLDDGRARPLDELVGAVGEEAALVALAEGVGFVERLCLEHLAALGADVAGPRSTSGGAVANRWWTGRRAAILGAPLAVPAVAEPALGAAVLARAGLDASGSGGGEPDLVAAAGAMVRVADRVDPEPVDGLDERYALLVDALRARGWTA